MKTFLKEVLLPLLIALCLAAFFKPVYIHDDYCIDIEAAEISQILLKIGELISNSYRSTKAEKLSES